MSQRAASRVRAAVERRRKTQNEIGDSGGRRYSRVRRHRKPTRTLVAICEAEGERRRAALPPAVGFSEVKSDWSRKLPHGDRSGEAAGMAVDAGDVQGIRQGVQQPPDAGAETHARRQED